MIRRLKALVIVTLALVVAAAVTLGAMIAWSRSALDRDYDVPNVDLALPTDPGVIADGQRMYRAYGCAECHGDDGAGRVVIPDGPGLVYAPNLTNLTPVWPVSSYERAIRHGVSPQGRPYLLMPSHDYWALDDASTAAIIAFVRTLPPVDRPSQASELYLLGHVLHALDVVPLVSAERVRHQAQRPPLPARGTLDFGEWMGRACTGCHGAQLSGGPIPGTDVAVLGTPANLTPHETGLLGWTEADLVTAMREGRTPDGRTLNPRQMPWESSYRYLTDEELHSLWLFLARLPPVEEGQR